MKTIFKPNRAETEENRDKTNLFTWDNLINPMLHMQIEFVEWHDHYLR